MCEFSFALCKSHVIDRNSDWFIALFASVLIGQSNFFGIGFFDIPLKTTPPSGYCAIMIIHWITFKPFLSHPIHNAPLESLGPQVDYLL